MSDGQIKDAMNIQKKFPFEHTELEGYINNPDSLKPLDVELLLIKANRLAYKPERPLFYMPDKNTTEVSSKDRQAAALFLKKRAGIPLYSGFEDIVATANLNVEQFMRVFSYFIDRLIYSKELNKNREISPEEQKKIFDNITSHYIDKIIKPLQYGNKINQLTENLCNFFKARTYEPNAPHAPGVTQFALLASEIQDLYDGKFPGFKKILTTAIAYNVIVPEPPTSQGKKGSEKKHPFSVNRLLCIHYELPLQKGDFQLIPIRLLSEMCDKSITPLDIKYYKNKLHQGLWNNNE
ncbi:hypothetical protein MBAV_003440 [Candidatus Magnetobacterium bavaricum]|uniref:Uncharacterized protein n=1 Tax=Candidatus Magnetobacterium bavaricum TaxID=29290 RepID=A0A0F3GRH9_9BACT|nr:hypothetical protein MBAV_003440 [Candidatus Magnetobacterium bavaricum]